MPEIHLPTKALQNTINASIGSTEDVADPNGSVHSKLKSIMAGGAGVIKSIQRGLVTAPTSGVTTNVTISAINLNKSIIINTTAFGVTGAIISFILTSPTNLQVKNSSSSNPSGQISWEVIEFE